MTSEDAVGIVCLAYQTQRPGAGCVPRGESLGRHRERHCPPSARRAKAARACLQSPARLQTDATTNGTFAPCRGLSSTCRPFERLARGAVRYVVHDPQPSPGTEHPGAPPNPLGSRDEPLRPVTARAAENRVVRFDDVTRLTGAGAHGGSPNAPLRRRAATGNGVSMNLEDPFSRSQVSTIISLIGRQNYSQFGVRSSSNRSPS